MAKSLKDEMLDRFYGPVRKTITKEELDLLVGAFEDPLAGIISWEPAFQGGANIKTFNLIKDGDYGVMRYKATFLTKLVTGWLYIFMGVWCLFFFFAIIPLLVAPFLFYFGIKNLIAVSKEISFDKQTGLFIHWIRQDGIVSKEVIPLKKIRAIQIIGEYVEMKVKDGKLKFNSYELNLVMDDATRANVIDHYDLESIREDAKIISKYLGVPTWDIGVEMERNKGLEMTISVGSGSPTNEMTRQTIQQ